MREINELCLWKKRSFCICAILFSLLIIYCTIRIIIPCKEFRYEGSYAFTADMPRQNTVVYDDICLKPGVYRIELDFETDTDMGAVCNVADGTVFTGGLLSNGEHLYSRRDRTEFQFWLYEGTENLQVVVSYGGTGSLTTGNLKIVETNQLWTMLLTAVLFVGGVILAGQVFYYYDKRFPVSAERKNAFFWISVISLIASIPYLCGYNIAGADLTYHLQRIEGVKDGLLAGQFPVRLEPKWVYGHGYANAIFYCNTFLYLPALLRLLGFPVSVSYNVYCIVLNIATAWISYVCFDRIFKSRSIGIVCSGLYTLSIFRIYKLIVTSAAGEGTATTFIPLVLYGLYRIFTEDPEGKKYKTSWVPLMLGISGLIQSHVLTCEITGLVIFFFCVVYIRKIFCRNTFLALLKGALSSLAVSLWFLVPFFDYYLTQNVHIKHVSARTIQDRGLYFAQLAFHFWTTGINTPSGDNGMQYSHPVGIGLVLMIGLGLFLILWFSGHFRKCCGEAVSFVKVSAVAGTLLLFMSMNIFPWDRIQSLHPIAAALVSSLQFPNRFLGWGTVCLVLVFGFCLQHFESSRRNWYAMAAVAVIGITTSSMHLLDSVNSTQDYFELYNEESMGFGYISGAEYLIEGTDEEKLTFALALPGEGVEILDYEKEYLRARMYCVNRAGRDSYVDLPLLLYKGYRAYCTDTGQELLVCAGDNNLVRVLIPAGFEGGFEVSFESPVYWRAGEAASILFLIALAVMCRKYRREIVEG